MIEIEVGGGGKGVGKVVGNDRRGYQSKHLALDEGGVIIITG